MPLTVYYWDMAGRAGAVIRMLDEAKVDYVHSTDFKEIAQQAVAFGNAAGTSFAPPIVVDGDDVISQSSATAQYIGEKYGFDVPKGKGAKASQIMGDAGDFFTELVKNLSSEEGKKWFDGRCKQWLGLFENNIQGPFVFGDKASYVDYNLLSVFDFCDGYCLDQLKAAGLDIYTNSPKLKKIIADLKARDSYQNSKTPSNNATWSNKASEADVAALTK